MNRHEIKPDDERPSLQERIGDNSIERGIPTDLNVKKHSTLSRVGFFIAALTVTAIAVGSLINFTGGSDEPEKKTEEETISSKTGNKNIAAEQAEILEMSSAAASEVSEPAPASEPQAESYAQAASTPTSDIPPDERFDSGLSPQGMDGMGNGAVASASFSGGESEQVEQNEAGTLESAPALVSNPLTAKLRPGVYQATVAENRGDLTYVLSRGTGIPCVTGTKIVTTHPGLTRCQVSRDVYSANGKTLLVERGSTVIGERTSALTQGQARVFVLWNTLETPEGIRVALDSPGGDSLGASGHPAKVNHHFWRRIGGAVMISMIKDVVTGINNRQSNRNPEVSFESTTESAQDLATEVLKNSINIPPTGYINQGTEIMIFVARDVDFSRVYENVTASERY